MFSSSQIIALIFIVALTVIVVVLTQKAVQVFKERKLNRKEAQEHEEMLEAVAQAKEHKFATTDGLVEGLVKDHDVVWVGLKGKKQRPSFEDLFSHEEMPMSTYEELIAIRDSLKEVQNHIKEEMYTPKFYTTHDTKRELGRDLVVYRHGHIRVTDRLMVVIGERPDRVVDILRTVMSYGSLDKSTRTIYDLDFIVTEDNPESKAKANYLLLHELLSDPEFEVENKEVIKINDNLEFYNDCITDGKAYISKGRVYAYFVASTPEMAPEPVVKSDINEMLKTAIDGRTPAEQA